jgi:phosphoglycolate phosphatase
MNAKTKFIVWDWNGTLLDNLHLCIASFNAAITKVGKPELDTLTFQNTYGFPLENFFMQNGFSTDEYNREKMNILNIFHDSYELGITSVGFCAGAEEILRTARGKGIHHIILSNHLIPSICELLDRFEARHFFWDILAHENRESQRRLLPKGERIKIFMQHHELFAENGIIVGDTPEETHIARDTGLTSVAITGGFATEERLREASPDYVLHSLTEMPAVLRERGFVT